MYTHQQVLQDLAMGLLNRLSTVPYSTLNGSILERMCRISRSDTDSAVSNHRTVKILARYWMRSSANFEPHPAQKSTRSTRGPFGATAAVQNRQTDGHYSAMSRALRLKVSNWHAPRAEVGGGRRWIEKSVVERPRRAESCHGARREARQQGVQRSRREPA